jgi:hypothetical protein
LKSRATLRALYVVSKQETECNGVREGCGFER